jgi:hypothetical protein
MTNCFLLTISKPNIKDNAARAAEAKECEKGFDIQRTQIFGGTNLSFPHTLPQILGGGVLRLLHIEKHCCCKISEECVTFVTGDF